MSRQCAATEDDWARIRALWETGTGFSACATAVEGRASKSAIARRATREGWERSVSGKRAGVPIPEELREERTREMQIARGQALAARRGEMIDGLIDDAFRLREQLFAPVLRREAKVISGGKDSSGYVEIVDIELPVMPPAAQKDTALAFAIIMDKMLLLAGEATGRTESINVERDALVVRSRQLRDQLSERRRAKELQDEQSATG